jgi:hypothetical protein
LTGTRDSIVQKFIDDFNLNAKNLFNFIAKGKEKVRKDFATAMSGRPGNRYQGDFVGMFGESIVNESYTTFNPGNSGRTTTHLDNKKYQLTKDVKGAQIGNYHNVVLPKGSIIHNLPGGVFINHPSLKDKFSGIKETPKFGFRVTINPDTLITIEKSSKILESVNEACWEGYKQVGGKMKNGKMVPNCVPISEDINSDDDVNYGLVEPEEYDVEDEDMVDFISFMRNYDKNLNEGCQCLREAEYQGREVKLGKPMQGDVKKFKVYVKNPAGNVVKVNFGQKGMKIRKSNPAARKSFRARMNCDSPGPRTKANYWSCRKW